MQPLARTSDVIVQQIDSDLVVYDQLRDAAHSLTPIAAHVYRHADGVRDVDALARLASDDLGVPTDPALVEAALAQLEQAHLVSNGQGMGRRDALRLGVAAALPLVISLSVPSPLLAQSKTSSTTPKTPKTPKPPKPPKPPKNG